MNSVTLYKNQAGTFKDHNLVLDTEDKQVIFHGGPLTNSAQSMLTLFCLVLLHH